VSRGLNVNGFGRWMMVSSSIFLANAKDFLTQIYKYFLAAMGVVVHRDVDVNMVVDWGWGCGIMPAIIIM